MKMIMERILNREDTSVAIHPGFVGHGIFIEGTASGSLGQYSGYPAENPPDGGLPRAIAGFVAALKDMAISSVWLELFNPRGTLDIEGLGGTRELVRALKSANIIPIGWGYCHHANTGRDGALAADLCHRYGITAFVADIEPGNLIDGAVDKWPKQAFVDFVHTLSTTFGKDNLALSTFARLDKQPDARMLMPLVTGDVAAFAPQVYWTFADPVTFAEDALASWQSAGVRTPIVATAQSYWDVADADHPRTPPRTEVEASVAKFVDGLPNSAWSSLVGLNWFHAGMTFPVEFEGAMSQAMIAKIAAAKINKKPFKQA
jgi:hypothetical protein